MDLDYKYSTLTTWSFWNKLQLVHFRVSFQR